ncbi:MAG: bifunctional 5,10-methylenetetrahydrofolate dehydrogenase/5,10-methenyltetrahydrofolate cyclohydrolase [Nanoarchaeota archaeon]
MVHLFQCNEIAHKYFSNVKKEIDLAGRSPYIKLFLASRDKGSESYAKVMIKKFTEAGIISDLARVDSYGELERKLFLLKDEEEVTGGFVFYPINFSEAKDSYFMSIVPEFKDIEGLSSHNIYRLFRYERNFPRSGCKAVVPCTAKAVIKTLLDENVKIEGKDVVILNKSYALGAPLRRMFDNLGATVTACDINTKKHSIEYYLKNADIVVTAVPKKEELFDDSCLKKGVSVIDCSFEGNFDFEKISNVAGNVSSRQSGNYIGPVTTSMAAVNTLYLFNYENYLRSSKP